MLENLYLYFRTNCSISRKYDEYCDNAGYHDILATIKQSRGLVSVSIQWKDFTHACLWNCQMPDSDLASFKTLFFSVCM